MKAESFGYKNAWIAAKGVTPEQLAKALRLRNMRASDWTMGISAAYEWPGSALVFVTPTIDDWVLCVGKSLFRCAEGCPPDLDLITCLARELRTEVQFFATHRIVEAHAWARARETGLERAYFYVGDSGEKLLDIGPLSREEKDLNFAFFDPSSPEAEQEGYWKRKDLTFPNEGHVMLLAQRWSVDPSTLEERDFEVPPGLVGAFGEAPMPQLLADRPQSQRPWWKFW